MGVVVQVGKSASNLVVQAGSAASTGVDWTAVSAVATFLAAFVALLVGVLPIWLSRRKRKKQAAMHAKVAIDVLTLQALQIGAAIRIPEGQQKIADAWQYKQVAKAVSVIDSGSLTPLIEYSEFLPSKADDALAQCIAKLDIAKRRLVFLHEAVPGDRFTMEGDINWYVDVVADVLSLRTELCQWLDVKADSVDEEAAQFAAKLRLVALGEREDWNARNPAGG
ncbi:hypothetical protein K7566_08550 [Stenotrophomonas maltophilia]|uniref:hypothetical protein n=1 Tax=Stenotrophomonas maltophilia TaxID=40324 RepID=UPI001D0FC8B6|nr:hypothetical protein [Stenotrophomonas maltophilia]UXB21732.1 hypothetical protein K7566_08550 [Stenotrophomonas maltophilia]